MSKAILALELDTETKRVKLVGNLTAIEALRILADVVASQLKSLSSPKSPESPEEDKP